MFTGIIQSIGELRRLERRGGDVRLEIATGKLDLGDVKGGDSIATSGVCLTVVGQGADWFAADVSLGTLSLTTLGNLGPGSRVNLEKSLAVTDRLGGHMVSGHVDAIGTITRMWDSGDGGLWMEVEVPPELERFLVDKGSITVDGISLTVVRPQGRRFSVALIPLTLQHTTLGRAHAGQAVNLEADLVAKWIDRLRRSGTGST